MNLKNKQIRICCIALLVFWKVVSMAQFSMPEGRYSVGFKYEWLNNYAQRNCGEIGADSLGKQILVGIWYPSMESNRKKQSLGDYINLQSLEGNSMIRDKLSAFGKKSWFEYTLQEYSDSTYREKAVAFDQVLSFVCTAVLNATALEKSFPVVIYHHGAGGTYDDNVMMCEYLASHGYVVISSTFLQCVRAIVFEETNWQENASDLQTILEYVHRQSNMNGQQVALMGHSRGCQIGYAMAMGRLSPYKCFIGLDPTWDGKSYEELYTAWGKPNILSYLYDNRRQMITPILHIASFRENSGIPKDSIETMNANYVMQFPVTDLFIHSERTLITTDAEHSHDAFIAQGGYDYARMRANLIEKEAQMYAEKQVEAYQLTNQIILAYLDDKLKESSTNEDTKGDFLKKLSSNKLVLRQDLRLAKPVPTLQAEWVEIIKKNGLKGLTERLEKEKKYAGYHEFSHENLARLFFHKNRRLCEEIIEHYATLHPKDWNTPFLKGTFAYNIGEIEQAKQYYKEALALSPPDYMIDFLTKQYFYTW